MPLLSARLSKNEGKGKIQNYKMQITKRPPRAGRRSALSANVSVLLNVILVLAMCGVRNKRRAFSRGRAQASKSCIDLGTLGTRLLEICFDKRHRELPLAFRSGILSDLSHNIKELWTAQPFLQGAFDSFLQRFSIVTHDSHCRRRLRRRLGALVNKADGER
ncbi:predicted protein [Histoplasma capsulatum H143]|uniref:Uncharacterized protein n=1 Tax=Ajellomyces capsulatus (strain H143) TaxID=544712 RepID=C6HHI7_AJECH|nr:predicted protein [Histoplasma capsulatum H143]